MGLLFTIAAGPRQHGHSRVRVPWDLWPYFTVSDSRLPFLSPPTTHRATVEVFNPASTRDFQNTTVKRLYMFLCNMELHKSLHALNMLCLFINIIVIATELCPSIYSTFQNFYFSTETNFCLPIKLHHYCYMVRALPIGSFMWCQQLNYRQCNKSHISVLFATGCETDCNELCLGVGLDYADVAPLMKETKSLLIVHIFKWHDSKTNNVTAWQILDVQSLIHASCHCRLLHHLLMHVMAEMFADSCTAKITAL
jgi:hypothetical protein